MGEIRLSKTLLLSLNQTVWALYNIRTRAYAAYTGACAVLALQGQSMAFASHQTARA